MTMRHAPATSAIMLKDSTSFSAPTAAVRNAMSLPPINAAAA